MQRWLLQPLHLLPPRLIRREPRKRQHDGLSLVRHLQLELSPYQHHQLPHRLFGTRCPQTRKHLLLSPRITWCRPQDKATLCRLQPLMGRLLRHRQIQDYLRKPLLATSLYQFIQVYGRIALSLFSDSVEPTIQE